MLSVKLEIWFYGVSIKKSGILDSIFRSGEFPNFILVTIHRAENTDDFKRLDKIVDIL